MPHGMPPMPNNSMLDPRLVLAAQAGLIRPDNLHSLVKVRLVYTKFHTTVFFNFHVLQQANYSAAHSTTFRRYERPKNALSTAAQWSDDQWRPLSTSPGVVLQR